MPERINQLIEDRVDFGFEPTLSSKGVQEIIDNAEQFNYRIIIVFFWLETVKLTINRVSIRVKEGGHNIPIETIQRRYYRGIVNFINTYQELAHVWLLIDNSKESIEMIAECMDGKITIYNHRNFKKFKTIGDGAEIEE